MPQRISRTGTGARSNARDNARPRWQPQRPRRNASENCVRGRTEPPPIAGYAFSMLGDKSAFAIVAVKDLHKAADFYGQTLGMQELSRQGEEAITYKTGNTMLHVYRSQYAGTNKANAVVFSVGNDLEMIVDKLNTQGVRFEHYDMPGITRKGDIHMAGDLKLAWFKDLDGNLLHLISR
jgi:catechol 2,3-dioxygenase-like lactoylglutathione lyase family enzyme